MLYAVHQDVEDSESNYVSYLDLEPTTKWIRSVSLFENCPPSIQKEFSMNSVVCLNFQNENYEALKVMLHHKSVQIYYACMNEVQYTNVNPSLQINDFECYYAFQCLLTHSHELIDQLLVKEDMNEFRNLMINNSQENTTSSKVLSDALYKIHSAISRCNIVLINYSIKLFLEKISKLNDEVSNAIFKENHLVLVKRAILIPTHTLFLPPQPILKSRALRSCNPDYSLRISLRDVNLETINFSFKGYTDDRKKRLKDFFENYFKKPLLTGIKIGKRHFMYVGSSTSQLRGHGLWFYAKDEKGKNAQMLREGFGNMNEIKLVPKYMARMGQTFSQAIGNIQIPQKFTNIDCPEEDIKDGVKEYMTEDDLDDLFKLKFLQRAEITDAENKSDAEQYTFSDGIGRMSLEVAEEVSVKLDLDETHTAMQIRYAGCKGMLAVDPNLEGRHILFRKSMKKFISSDDSLEIIKLNEKRVASLNRPLITILEQLGVEKHVFVKLQKKMILNLIKSMFYEPDARDLLQRNSKLRFNFLSMYENGISLTRDPLFRSMIYALFQKQIELLKNKANIEIPVDKGRSMFGVLDETFTLEYGQVFIQYTCFEDDKKHIVHTGPVVVTKNPCMHPGDVRKFEAVDVKDLHHICDCIVFPAKGPRPHPDEMAGSDLDGDEYHVMWFEDFIFSRENEAAMHYAIRKNEPDKDKTESEEEKYEDKKIMPEDEMDHLCNYIVHDNVGLIANAHLVFADKDKKGIFSEHCIRLAKMYSVALDFAKSGKIARRNPKDRVYNYPDFMKKFGEKRTYISKKALGILFRNCKRLEMGLETKNSQTEYKLDPDLVYENWEKYEKSAKKIYSYYCRKIDYLMNVYSFSTEGELLAGTIINPPKYFEQRHDLDNLMALLEYEMRWIFKDLENIFFREFGKKPKNAQFTEEMFQKASAWYIVAYRKDVNKVGCNYFGLPWAVAEVLLAIKQKKYRLAKNKVANFKSVLEGIIDNYLMSDTPLSQETPINIIYDKRLSILDKAGTILGKWLDTQKDHVLIEDLKKFKKQINRELEILTNSLSSCSLQYINNLKETGDLKKAISPAYYIVQTLLHLASTKFVQQKTSTFGAEQELSLLSWVTLIKLACTYNPNYLGIGETSSDICLLPQDSIVSIFKIHLFHENEYNEEFTEKLLHQPDEVIRYLQKVSKVKNIDFRYGIDLDKKYIAIFTVLGSKYAIEKLRDLVVQDDFFKWVVKRQKLFATDS